uniref:Uncharacterized protein n=1 Tax=Pseudomonas phage Cygsa01 TaxID=3138529 RepID=A0AAU6W445_9VIRU
MEIFKTLLSRIDATPEGSRNTMAHRDAMYELSVKLQSIELTIPRNLMTCKEIDQLDRARILVDNYYSNMNSFGVAV